MLAGPPLLWDKADSISLFKLQGWSQGFFKINESGDVCFRLKNELSGESLESSLPALIAEIAESKQLKPPFILRFPQIFADRIEALHRAFNEAITQTNYHSSYYGLFPIKVNQSHSVVDQIASLGAHLNLGFEVGSKAELLVAMGCSRKADTTIVVNGYKDAGFIGCAFDAQHLGFNVIIVLETLQELNLVIEAASRESLIPQLGIRLRLSSPSNGHWEKTNETFGLTTIEIISVIDRLKALGKINWLTMLHFHQGSQLGQLNDILLGIDEAARVYTSLIQEGAQLNMLNIGGGLGVNYDGAKKDPYASNDYTFEEYALQIVAKLLNIFTDLGIPHPQILSESGRGTAASQSVFVFDVHDVSPFYIEPDQQPLDTPQLPFELSDILTEAKVAPLVEFSIRRASWETRIREMFLAGQIDLRQRALAESELRRIAVGLAKSEFDCASLEIHDVVYANCSVFQSLPDHWGIKQKFPIMPLQRLNEAPDRLANISDLTCDSDGTLKFTEPDTRNNAFVPIHQGASDSDYFLGVFLTGAYQESLGNLHNLLGRTPSIDINLTPLGAQVGYCRKGQSNRDVLAIFDHNPDSLANRIKELIAQAAINNPNSSVRLVGKADAILSAYKNNLDGHSYLSTRNQ